MYPDAEPDAVDLIDKMLVFDPTSRITVEEALSHPYLASLHDVSDEPSASGPFEFSFEGEAMTEERVRELVHAELTEYHDEIRREGGGEGGVEGGAGRGRRGQSRTGRGSAVSEGRDFFFGQ